MWGFSGRFNDSLSVVLEYVGRLDIAAVASFLPVGASMSLTCSGCGGSVGTLCFYFRMCWPCNEKWTEELRSMVQGIEQDPSSYEQSYD